VLHHHPCLHFKGIMRPGGATVKVAASDLLYKQAGEEEEVQH